MKKIFIPLILLSLTAALFSAEPIVWNLKNKFKGWGTVYRCKKSMTENGMSLAATGRDGTICNNGVRFNSKDYSQILIEYRATGLPEKNNGKLYYATSVKDFNESYVWHFSGLKSDGKWHILTLFNDSKKWQNAGTVTKLMLDILVQGKGSIEIRSITLTNPEEE